MAKPSPKGIIAQPSKANIRVMQGPIINNKLLDCLGIMISLTSNFKASAKGCNNPHIPTALGPHRRCIAPIIFLSAIVTNATVIKMGTNIISISNILNSIFI
jgi:hypothetical protein